MPCLVLTPLGLAAETEEYVLLNTGPVDKASDPRSEFMQSVHTQFLGLQLHIRKNMFK